jgi:exodeoxyribonuclease VII large subunit
VQGDGSAEEVAAAVKELTDHGAVDLLIIARGGGSLEDLWAFNEEVVVRAVAACPLPTISAVGHETDVTLCDLVADVRAPTPSAAAELAVPERDSYRQLVDDQTNFLETLVARRLADWHRRLEVVEHRHRLHQPLARIASRFEILHERRLRLDQGILRLLNGKDVLATAWIDRLNAADPENILRRGYIMVSRKANGEAVTRRKQVVKGEELLLRFTDGTVGAVAREGVASS